MRNLLSRLWNDDGGFLISMEMLFTAVILVLGLIAGWAAVRAALITEYVELAGSIAALNQSFQISSIFTTTGGNQGSGATDTNPATKINIYTDTTFTSTAGFATVPYAVDNTTITP